MCTAISDQKWAGLVASALEMACFKILCADYAHITNIMHRDYAQHYARGYDQKLAGLVVLALETVCFKMLCADYACVSKYYARGLCTAICTGLTAPPRTSADWSKLYVIFILQ